MRKCLMFIALVMAMVMVAGTASATLLGIRNYAGAVPDIYYDAGGTASYDASHDKLTVNAWDHTLYLEKPGSGIDLASKVDFYLEVGVDENGNFTGTGVMEEKVNTAFSFVWQGKTYSFDAGDIFLKGNVIAFGWDNLSDGTTFGEIDYLLGPVSGKLVNYGLWPTSPPTGGYLDLKAQIPGWDSNWGDLLTEKGDKYPVPEPATMFLLGSGLLGLAGWGRKRFKKS